MANANFLRLGEATGIPSYWTTGMPPVRVAVNTYLVDGVFVIERFVFSMSGSTRMEKRFNTREAFEAFLVLVARQYPWTEGKLL